MNYETQYRALLRELLDKSNARKDRTGVGTTSVFGRMLRHDLSEGFPLLTCKKVHTKSVIEELLWMLNGSSNIRSLQAAGVSIWDEWANETGEIGPLYGPAWRRWKGDDGQVYDQVQAVIDSLRERPYSRRHIINAWNVAYLPDERVQPEDNVNQGRMALAPCHVMYQFYVEDGRLSCMLTQRSADTYLGAPFNIAAVSFLTSMMAQQVGLVPGEVIHSLGDAHLYLNHREQAELFLSRTPKDLPTLKFARHPEDMFSYQRADFIIEGYDPHPSIPAPIAK